MERSMEESKKLAGFYENFCKNVKAHAKLMAMIGYHAVTPQWVQDEVPYLAFIDGVKNGEKVRLRAECGSDGKVNFHREPTR